MCFCCNSAKMVVQHKLCLQQQPKPGAVNRTTPPWSCWMPSACRCLSADASCARTAANSSPVFSKLPVLLSVWCLFDQGTGSLNYQIFLFSRTLLEPVLVIPTSRTNPQQLEFGKLVARPMPNWVFSPKFPLEAAMAVIAISLKGLFRHLTHLLMVQDGSGNPLLLDATML